MQSSFLSKFVRSHNIGVIVDFEGYHTRKGFMIKEFGFISMVDYKPYSIFVRLPNSFQELSVKDRKTVAYVMKHIHGLKYENHPDDISYEDMLQHLWFIYEHHATDNQNVVFAYKGGQAEKHVLDYLGIPSINLEDVGLMCNFKYLMPTYGTQLENVQCDRHIPIGDVVHCPKLELSLFAAWLTDSFPAYSQPAPGKEIDQNHAVHHDGKLHEDRDRMLSPMLCDGNE